MAWLQILDFVMAFGLKAIMWAWDNKWKLISLGEAVFDFILSVWATATA